VLGIVAGDFYLLRRRRGEVFMSCGALLGRLESSGIGTLPASKAKQLSGLEKYK
jgi:hypothetical protein